MRKTAIALLALVLAACQSPTNPTGPTVQSAQHKGGTLFTESVNVPNLTGNWNYTQVGPLAGPMNIGNSCCQIEISLDPFTVAITQAAKSALFTGAGTSGNETVNAIGNQIQFFSGDAVTVTSSVFTLNALSFVMDLPNLDTNFPGTNQGVAPTMTDSATDVIYNDILIPVGIAGVSTSPNCCGAYGTTTTTLYGSWTLFKAGASTTILGQLHALAIKRATEMTTLHKH